MNAVYIFGEETWNMIEHSHVGQQETLNRSNWGLPQQGLLKGGGPHLVQESMLLEGKRVYKIL